MIKFDTQLINSARLTEAVQAVCRKFPISKYLIENGLHESPDPKGGNTFIVCPFHVDHSPSFSYNDSRGLWHCFSCERGGNYINLVQNVQLIKHENRLFYSRIVDDILKADHDLQQQLGYVSIFVQEQIIVDEAFTLSRVKWRDEEPRRTFVSLANEMIKDGKDNITSISFAQELMFQYYSADRVYDSLQQMIISTPHDPTFNIPCIEDILRDQLGSV